jgi:hypothetical protein
VSLTLQHFQHSKQLHNALITRPRGFELQFRAGTGGGDADAVMASVPRWLIWSGLVGLGMQPGSFEVGGTGVAGLESWRIRVWGSLPSCGGALPSGDGGEWEWQGFGLEVTVGFGREGTRRTSAGAATSTSSWLRGGCAH